MTRPTTVDTPLTPRQTRFAAAVANGKPRTQAHRENYAVDKFKNSQSAARRAAEYAQKPNVAAEIRRLTWLSCPPLHDTAGMREHAVRVLSDLSRTSTSDEVRLKSALALFKIAETTLAAARPTTSEGEQDKLLASLRKLYVEVQGTAAKYDAADDPYGKPIAPAVGYDDEPIDIDAIAEPSAAAPRPAAEPEEPGDQADPDPAEPGDDADGDDSDAD